MKKVRFTPESGPFSALAFMSAFDPKRTFGPNSEKKSPDRSRGANALLQEIFLADNIDDGAPGEVLVGLCLGNPFESQAEPKFLLDLIGLLGFTA